LAKRQGEEGFDIEKENILDQTRKRLENTELFAD